MKFLRSLRGALRGIAARRSTRRGPASSSLELRAVRIAVGYGLFASLWIYFSDRALSFLIADPEQLARWSVLKGLAFVALTSILLLLLIRRAFGAIEAGYASLKENETEIERLERLYSALSHINQAIVRMPTRDELFRSVCKILVEHGGFAMAWIGWHDPQTHRLVPLADWGDEYGYLKSTNIYADDRPEGRGPSGTAFREGRSNVCNDLRNDPAMLPWRAEAERRGLRAAAGFPIRTNDEVNGVLVVYAYQPGFFQSQEIALLAEAAVDISFALDNLAREAQRRQATQESRHLAERLTTTLESITDAFFTLDRSWCFSFLNREAERLLKRTRAELIGRNIWTEFSAAIGSVFEREYRRAMANGQTVEFEEFYPPLNTWFSVRAYPSEEGLAVYFRDINQRRLADEAIQQRLTLQEQIASTAASVPGMIYSLRLRPDGSTRMPYVSGALKDIFDLQPDEVVEDATPIFSLIHPDDVGHVKETMAESARTMSHWRDEFRLCRNRLGEIWVEGHSVPQREPDGSVLWHGFIQDISERKRAEKSLLESRQRLALATESAHIGIWDWNVVEDKLVWDAQMYQLYGIHEQDFGGAYEAWQKGLHPDDRARGDAEMAAALDGSREFHPQFRVVWPGGEIRHIEAHAIVQRAADGSATHVIGVNWDITERKHDEQALRGRARRQELIAILGRTALVDTNVEHVLAEAATVVATGLDVEYSKVMQLVANDRSFILKAGVGWEPGWLDRRISGADADTRLSGVLSSLKPVIIDDFAGDPGASASEILRAHGIASGVDVAIVGAEGPYGVLGAYSREVRKFGGDNLDFLESVANIIAAAMDRKRREAQLAHLAQYDSLTELPNRLLIKDRLTIAMAQAQRSGKRLALLYMDLDQFKKVNDSLGHDVGDRLLQELARRISGSVRTSDTVSRQGGDEFLVVLSEVDNEEDAARVAEKLLEAISQPVTIREVELLVTGSIGIAFYPDNGNDVETLLRNADAAMYAAKDMGRNRFQFYSQDMNARARERLMMEADLRRAIERDELFLQFQPQVVLGSRMVKGAEALVRWRHPTLGVVAPGLFIPIAEESGLIISIGSWVLETACRQQAKWLEEGIARGPMSVNVSAPQFRQPGFVAGVIRILETTGLDPRHLELELTESVVMQGLDIVREKLASLDNLGVKLAIDDFGTGYSSLSYLRQFPIHRLKIDRSFVTGLPDDKESGAIAQAVISLGHSLGLNVVAEGVETEAQAEFLLSLWCDDAQGFLYSKPLFPADFAAFLRSHERPANPRIPEGA